MLRTHWELNSYSPSSTILDVFLDRDGALPTENLPASCGCLTSFSEYRERATMSSSFFVSAWNSCLEAVPGIKVRVVQLGEEKAQGALTAPSSA